MRTFGAHARHVDVLRAAEVLQLVRIRVSTSMACVVQPATSAKRLEAFEGPKWAATLSGRCGRAKVEFVEDGMTEDGGQCSGMCERCDASCVKGENISREERR